MLVCKVQILFLASSSMLPGYTWIVRDAQLDYHSQHHWCSLANKEHVGPQLQHGYMGHDSQHHQC